MPPFCCWVQPRLTFVFHIPQAFTVQVMIQIMLTMLWTPKYQKGTPVGYPVPFTLSEVQNGDLGLKYDL